MNILRLIAPLFCAVLAALPAGARERLDLAEGDGVVVTLPKEASAVFVADPSVADAQASSGKTIYVSGIAAGRTTIIAMDFEDGVIEEYVVNVRPSNSDAASLAGSGGTAVAGTGNVAVVRGHSRGVAGAMASTAAADELRNSGRIVLDQGTIGGGVQVQLRVRFVEASRRDLRALGVNLAGVGGGRNSPIRFVTGIGDPSGFINNGGSGPTIGVRGTPGNMTVDAMIDALETKGVVQILSEPTLTTVSGRRANFQAGGEIAYPVNQGDGVISAGFKPYGVSIDFLPVVLPNGRIAIEVAPEVSFIDNAASVQVEGFAAPGLSVRRAETTVEVGSGQTFAIAGLYQQTSSSGSSGLPGMSKIFGRSNSSREERELMIFITPYLAEAADAAEPRKGPVSVAETVGFILK